MSTYIPQLDPIPTQHAFFDGREYHCYETRCMIVHAKLEECYRCYHEDLSYVPILRCSCCGGYYWGSITEDPEAYEQYKEKPEEEKKRKPQDLHKQQPTEDNTGDVTLPNLFTV